MAIQRIIQIEKNVFYVFIGIVAVINLLLMIVEKVVLQIPDRFKPVPNKHYWLSSEETRSALNYVLSDWIFGFASIFNMCVSFCFFVFWQINTDTHKNILSYEWLAPVIAAVLLLPIVYLPIRLTISKILIR